MSRISLGSAFVDIVVDDSRLQHTLGSLQIRITSLVASMTGLTNATGALSLAFTGLAAAAAAVAAAVGAGVYAAASFESQMAKVATLLSGDALKALPTFAARIQDLSREFGQSTSDLADGLFNIISAGIAPADALGVLREATIAAKGGFTDTAVAVEALDKVLIGYNISARDAGKVTDQLTAAANAGLLDFDGLARNIGKVAPQAAKAGLSLDELLAAFSTLSQTTSPQETATLLENAFKGFAAASPQAQAAAKQFGVQLDAAAISGGNLLGTLERMRSLSFEQLLKLFPDIRAARGIQALAGNVEFLRNTINEVANSSGASLTAFGKVAETTSFRFSQFWQSVKAEAVEFGNLFLPAFNVSLAALTGWVDNTTTLLRRIQAPVRDALASVAGAIQGAVGQIVPVAQAIGQGMMDAFVGTVRFLQPLWEAFANTTVIVFRSLYEALAPVAQAIAGAVRDAFGFIAPYVLPILTAVRDGIIRALFEVAAAFVTWRQLLDVAISNVALAAVTTFNDMAFFLTTTIPEALDWFARHWKEVFTDLFDGTMAIFTNLGKNIVNFFSALVDWIASGFTDAFNFDWTPLLDGFKSTISQMPQFTERQMTEVEKKLAEGVNNAEKNLSDKRDELRKSFFGDITPFDLPKLPEVPKLPEIPGGQGPRIPQADNATAAAALDAKAGKISFVGLQDAFKKIQESAVTDIPKAQLEVAKRQLDEQQKTANAADAMQTSNQQIVEELQQLNENGLAGRFA